MRILIASNREGARPGKAGRKGRAAPDAVVLELPPRGRDGWALLQEWRRAGRPVCVLALDDPASETARPPVAEADACLAGPFLIEELSTRLRALTRRGPVRGPVLRSHDLEIDPDARAVRRAGRPIRLTSREYALLEFLALRPGLVVSRAAIWEGLYGAQAPARSNVIDVYIRHLRNKIDKGFDPPLILTRWGEGYLLRGDSRGE
jgi:DNA-binding response OmpR family regulator